MSNRIVNKVVLTIACCAIVLSLQNTAVAVCHGVFLNPVTDVCWECIFPIKIGGLIVWPGDIVDSPDLTSSPVLACPSPIGPRPCTPASFWEPARFVETVKEPFCFPSIGTSLSNPSPGLRGGGVKKQGSHSTFAQSHYFIFPVWSLMQIVVDSACAENEGFDVAYITEVDPLWNDDLIMAMLQPEAILFANPAAQLACVADAAASNIGLPLSPLYWCMGSWGSAYPLTGHHNSADYVQGNAAIAAKTIYKMGRQLLLMDPAVALCAAVPTPIWVKHNYRLQEAKPVRDFTCHPIGVSSMVWGYAKNPPYGAGGNAGDNFLWLIFRKHSCCIF